MLTDHGIVARRRDPDITRLGESLRTALSTGCRGSGQLADERGQQDEADQHIDEVSSWHADREGGRDQSTSSFRPAEEGLGGATAMITDGMVERFPCDAGQVSATERWSSL